MHNWSFCVGMQHMEYESGYSTRCRRGRRRRNSTGARWCCGCCSCSSDRKCVHPDHSRWHFSAIRHTSWGHDLWRSLCIYAQRTVCKTFSGQTGRDCSVLTDIEIVWAQYLSPCPLSVTCSVDLKYACGNVSSIHSIRSFRSALPVIVLLTQSWAHLS